MRYILVVFLVLVASVSFSQSRKAKRKISNARGVIYGSLGYNRSAYTKTNAHFEGTGYNFNLKHAAAQDNQSKLGSGDYLTFSSQFNLKLGYHYKNVWSISVGLDHMKYVFANYNHVTLNGSVTMDANNVTFGDSQSFATGFYTNVPVSTYNGDFSYATTKGINFIHADLNRTIKLIGIGKKNNFVLCYNAAVGAGGLFTSIDYNFAGRLTTNTTSFSGYAISVSNGLRAEFFRHAYFYTNFSLGALHQLKVKTRPDDFAAYSSQFFGYCQLEAGVGFLLYKRGKNACDDCPVW